MPTKAPVKLSTVSYIILYVPNTSEALKFYRDTLGIKVRMDEDGWVELETGSTTVALHGEKQADKARSGGRAVVVFNVDDISEAYEQLKAKGVKFEKEPQIVCETGDHVGKSADFTDPYGNQLSIYAMEPIKGKK